MCTQYLICWTRNMTYKTVRYTKPPIYQESTSNRTFRFGFWSTLKKYFRMSWVDIHTKQYWLSFIITLPLYTVKHGQTPDLTPRVPCLFSGSRSYFFFSKKGSKNNEMDKYHSPLVPKNNDLERQVY